MKRIIITFAALALCFAARAQDNTLSTTDGVAYRGISFQRVEPDGIYIEYAIPGGGMGMSKIKFDRLPRNVQKQFGYNKDTARDYEAQVAQANQDAANELNQRYETRQAARRQRDQENQNAYAGRMAEMSRINAAQAAAFYRSMTSNPQSERSIEYGTQGTTGHVSTQTTFTTLTPDIFPNRGTTIKSH